MSKRNVLKAIGFKHELQWSVRCQAGIAAAVGIEVGVPLAIALAGWIRTLFAEDRRRPGAPIVPVFVVIATR
jgi:hypothetical protein